MAMISAQKGGPEESRYEMTGKSRAITKRAYGARPLTRIPTEEGDLTDKLTKRVGARYRDRRMA